MSLVHSPFAPCKPCGCVLRDACATYRLCRDGACTGVCSMVGVLLWALCLGLRWCAVTCVLKGVECWPMCGTRRKQHRPGIAPNDNTTHVPTAGSSAALTRPNHTPTRAKGKLLLQTVTPHATHTSHTSHAHKNAPSHQAGDHPEPAHTERQNPSKAWRRGRNDNQDSPRELSAHRANGIAADQAESRVSGAARRGGRKRLGG